MIHVFHGFLGSPKDFSFLESNPNVKLHDLYLTSAEAISRMVNSQDILIGYSMGGRLALQIAADKKFDLKKIILINAHPGLIEEERQARANWEDEVLEKLANDSSADFLIWWNSLPIFKHDQPIQTPIDAKKSSVLFENMRLSHQPNYLPLIKAHKEKVLWIIGELDEKYLSLAHDYLKPNDIPFITLPGGHRLFQQSQALMNILKAQNIL